MENDPTIKAVLVRGQGSRAFCAGGDIRRLYDEGGAGTDYPRRFYHAEYRLNARLHRFAKPYIAFLDGIVMGGGVGVSVHGSHRIATENTLFAMPETGIGLFPDVGGSYFLSRCPGALGMYLGLTGAGSGRRTRFIAVSPRVSFRQPIGKSWPSCRPSPISTL